MTPILDDSCPQLSSRHATVLFKLYSPDMPMSSLGSTTVVLLLPHIVTQEKQVQKDEWLVL